MPVQFLGADAEALAMKHIGRHASLCEAPFPVLANEGVLIASRFSECADKEPGDE